MSTLKSAFHAGEEFTRTLWHANLGLYGYGYDFAKSRYQRTRKLLDNLADHGAEVEGSARAQLETLGEGLRDRASEVRQRSEKLVDKLPAPVGKALSLYKSAAIGLRDRLVIPPARPITLLSERQLCFINGNIETYNAAITRLTGAGTGKAKPAPKARQPRARKAKAAPAIEAAAE